MNYLQQIHQSIFQAVLSLELKHADLLICHGDANSLLDFPCESKEAYTLQTGREISDKDYNIIIALNSLYAAYYEIDYALNMTND